jgi:hypothetical protein
MMVRYDWRGGVGSERLSEFKVAEGEGLFANHGGGEGIGGGECVREGAVKVAVGYRGLGLSLGVYVPWGAGRVGKGGSSGVSWQHALVRMCTVVHGGCITQQSTTGRERERRRARRKEEEGEE